MYLGKIVFIYHFRKGFPECVAQGSCFVGRRSVGGRLFAVCFVFFPPLITSCEVLSVIKCKVQCLYEKCYKRWCFWSCCEVWSVQWEVLSVIKCAVPSVKCEVPSVNCIVWSLKCGVWSVESEVWSVKCGDWSEKCGVWCGKCEVWIGECGVLNAQRLKCEVCSGKCWLWSSVQCQVLSVKCEVHSVKCIENQVFVKVQAKVTCLTQSNIPMRKWYITQLQKARRERTRMQV